MRLSHTAAALYGDEGFGLSPGSSGDLVPPWLALSHLAEEGWVVSLGSLPSFLLGRSLPLPISNPQQQQGDKPGDTAPMSARVWRGSSVFPPPSCLCFQGSGKGPRPGAPARMGAQTDLRSSQNWGKAGGRMGSTWESIEFLVPEPSESGWAGLVLRWGVCGREGSPQKGLWGGLGQEPRGWDSGKEASMPGHGERAH